MVTATLNEKDLVSKLDKIEAWIDKESKTPASQVKGLHGGQFFGAFSGPAQSQNDYWPLEQIKKRLKDSYQNDHVVDMLAKGSNGKPRGIGWGPMLKRFRDIKAGEVQIGSDSYEALEKQYGLVASSRIKDGMGHLEKFYGPNSMVLKTALAEGSGTTGGYVVPPDFVAELLTIAGEDAFIEQRCHQVPMTTRTRTYPSLDITTAQSSGTSPYAGGVLAQWTPEAGTFNESEPKFRQIELTAWDLTLYAVASNQLLEDNAVGLDALLTQLFGWAVPYYKEWAFMQGTGSGTKMPLGVLNAPATIFITRASSGAVQYVDLLKMFSQVQIRSWANACWVMHQSVIPQLGQMFTNASSGDRLAWASPIGDGKQGAAAMALPKTIFGLPVFFTDKVPKLGTAGCIGIYDFGQYLAANRLDVQIDVSPHVNFLQGQMVWRVRLRADGRPWLNSYVTDASGWTVSPFVSLTQ